MNKIISITAESIESEHICCAMGKGKEKKAWMKEHYLTDKKFFVHKGFRPIDEAPPYFELLAYPFKETAELPRFSPSVREEWKSHEADFLFVHSDQCPFGFWYKGRFAGHSPMTEKMFDKVLAGLTP